MTEDKKEIKNKKAGGFRYFLSHFSKKHRLSIRDQHTDTEIWYLYISTMRIFFAFLGMLIVMFAVVALLVVYTPVLDTLPGYPGRKSRELLMESIVRIDSLKSEIGVMQAYTDNVLRIVEGSVSAPVEEQQKQDSVAGDKRIVPRSMADADLRSQLEGSGRYALSDFIIATQSRARGIEFISPVRGRITTSFNPVAGNYGVGVALSGSQEVLAVQEGTVIMSMWTLDDGYVIQLQHKNNYISFYKHASQLLKSVGDRVVGGEVIGYASMDGGAAGENAEFVFELWHEGQPVDPQRYIIF